jgi:hypothetical protein
VIGFEPSADGGGSALEVARAWDVAWLEDSRGALLVDLDNDGDQFTDHSLAAGVTTGGWAWSSALADLNNDGWQDIAIANGYLTNMREDDL